jgi:hypothetical protein
MYPAEGDQVSTLSPPQVIFIDIRHTASLRSQRHVVRVGRRDKGKVLRFNSLVGVRVKACNYEYVVEIVSLVLSGLVRYITDTNVAYTITTVR